MAQNKGKRRTKVEKENILQETLKVIHWLQVENRGIVKILKLNIHWKFLNNCLQRIIEYHSAISFYVALKSIKLLLKCDMQNRAQLKIYKAL